MATTREELETRLLREELASLEERAYSIPQLVSLAAHFNMAGGQKLGMHLNSANVIVHIVPNGMVAQEGSLRKGDKIIAVNTTPADGTDVAQLIQGLDSVLFVVARQVIYVPDDEESEEEEDEENEGVEAEGDAGSEEAPASASDGVPASPVAAAKPLEVPVPVAQLQAAATNKLMRLSDEFARRVNKLAGTSNGPGGSGERVVGAAAASPGGGAEGGAGHDSPSYAQGSPPPPPPPPP